MEGRRIGRRYGLEVPDRTCPGARAFRARDEATGAAVVLTLLDEAPGADATLSALAGLRHPALPVILDHGVDPIDGTRYLAAPPRAARTARAACGSRPLAGAEVAALGATLAGALAALHAAGLVHGGVSLDAVAWEEDGSPHLEDLATAGLARPPLGPERDLRDLGLLLREASGAALGADLLEVAGMPPRLAAVIGALESASPPTAASAEGVLRQIADGVEPDPALRPPAPEEGLVEEPPAKPRRGGRGLRVLVGILAMGVAVLAFIAIADLVDRRDASRRAADSAIPGPVTTIAASTEDADAMSLPEAEETAPVETAAQEEPPEPIAAGPQAIGIASARAVDPGGLDGENDGQARRAIDGSPGTAWRTEEYKEAGLGGKDGVGLVLRLDAPARITSVVLRTRPVGAVVELYAIRGEGPDTAPAGWEPIAGSVELARTRTAIPVRRRRPVTEVLVWITQLPGPVGAHAVAIGDVRVRGYPRGA